MGAISQVASHAGTALQEPCATGAGQGCLRHPGRGTAAGVPGLLRCPLRDRRSASVRESHRRPSPVSRPCQGAHQRSNALEPAPGPAKRSPLHGRIEGFAFLIPLLGTGPSGPQAPHVRQPATPRLHPQRFRLLAAPRTHRPAPRARAQRIAPARWPCGRARGPHLSRAAGPAAAGRPAGVQRHARGQGPRVRREGQRRQGGAADRARARGHWRRGGQRGGRPHEGEQEARRGRHAPHGRGPGGRGLRRDAAGPVARRGRPAVPLRAVEPRRRGPACADGAPRPHTAAALHRAPPGRRRRSRCGRGCGALPDGVRARAGCGGGAHGGAAFRRRGARVARGPRRGARERHAARGRRHLPAREDREPGGPPHAQRVVRGAAGHAGRAGALPAARRPRGGRGHDDGAHARILGAQRSGARAIPTSSSRRASPSRWWTCWSPTSTCPRAR